jgi:excisionase family DNA binding protein
MGQQKEAHVDLIEAFRPVLEEYRRLIVQDVVELLDQRREATANRKMITIKEAAQYLGRTVPALRAMIHRREIPCKRIGRRIFFDLKELDRWIAVHIA